MASELDRGFQGTGLFGLICVRIVDAVAVPIRHAGKNRGGILTDESGELVVFEVDPIRFQQGRDLFRDIWFDAAQIGSAFDGMQAGRLFVDDLERPIAAMLARTFEYYVGGSADSKAMRAFIRDAPAEAGVFADLYGYAPTTVAWSLAILADYQSRLVVVPRRGFHWIDTEANRAALEPMRETPPGVEVRPINGELARRIERDLHEDVAHFWNSLDDFLSSSFGYCTLVDDNPASIAYAIAAGIGEANIGVFTASAYRRQGHALRACAAYIDHCLRLGLIPTWDADSDNPRSVSLARKLGFVEGPPFSELSPPQRTKLRLSEGLWEKQAIYPAINRYRRRV